MDLNRRPSEIASNAAEEIRALNHRTLKAGSYETAPEIAYALGHLLTLIERLPQALQQMENGLTTLDDEQKIRLADRHPSEVSQADLTHAVSTVRFGLKEGREMLTRVQELLRESNQVASSLGGPWPEDDASDGEG
ncbi:hypothetical protein SUDANB145_07246 (plasmid) [Streptomyces sp. enrichment culture]|uniref:hypothetical protein n=1 Tax=Streptomyces sp. enrichment culture TaxID=1795815 RepID=UPI003F562894